MIGYNLKRGSGAYLRLTPPVEPSGTDTLFQGTVSRRNDVNNSSDALSRLYWGYSDRFDTQIRTIQDAIIQKGITPESNSLEDIVAAISSIESATAKTESIGTNENTYGQPPMDLGQDNDVRYLDTTMVNNYNYSKYTFSYSDPLVVDLGERNRYRSADATEIYNRGKDSILMGFQPKYYKLHGFDGINQTRTINIPSGIKGMILFGSCGLRIGADSTGSGTLDLICWLGANGNPSVEAAKEVICQYSISSAGKTTMKQMYGAYRDDNVTDTDLQVHLELNLKRVEASEYRKYSYVEVMILTWS